MMEMLNKWKTNLKVRTVLFRCAVISIVTKNILQEKDLLVFGYLFATQAGREANLLLGLRAIQGLYFKGLEDTTLL